MKRGKAKRRDLGELRLVERQALPVRGSESWAEENPANLLLLFVKFQWSEALRSIPGVSTKANKNGRNSLTF